MKAGIPLFYCMFSCLGFRYLSRVLLIKDDVDDYAQDESSSDRRDGDRSKVQRKAADAGNQNSSNHEEIAVIPKINRLQHFEAADRNESIESNAHAAGNAGRHGIDKRDKWAKESKQDAVNRCDEHGRNGSVTGDGHTAHALTVGGIGAAAEESADDRADAVANQRTVQTGLRNQVAVDDGTEVFVVRDMLSQRNKSNRRKQHEEVEQATDAVKFGCALACNTRKDELRYCKQLHVLKCRKVDDLKRSDPGRVADKRQNKANAVSRHDTYNERDHAQSITAPHRSPNRNEESENAERYGNEAVSCRAALQIADCAPAKRETDQGDRRANDNRRKQTVNPRASRSTDDCRDHHIDETGKQRSEEDAQIAKGSGADQRRNKSERASEEDRAHLFRYKEIEQRAETRAAKRCRLTHISGTAAGIHQHGNQKCRRHDRQHLLESVHQVLLNRRSFIDIVHELHTFNFLPGALRQTLPAGVKKPAVRAYGELRINHTGASCRSPVPN